MLTREEWLRHAVEQLDTMLFEGDLDLLNHEYQIAYGRCPGKKLTETIQPSDNENLTMADFFPTTISVSFTISDPIQMLGCLAHECLHAFFNVKSCATKKFKTLANKYYFDKPFKEYHPTQHLEDILKDVYKTLVNQYGEFPGKAIKFPEKEQKEKKKNSFTLFCNECGYELKIARKVFDKYNQALPTCPCGCKLAVDLSDEAGEDSENKN